MTGSLRQQIQVLGPRNSQDSPHDESGFGDSGGVIGLVWAVKLGPRQTRLPGASDDFFDGLIHEDSEHRNASRGGHYLRRSREAHPPASASKNDA